MIETIPFQKSKDNWSDDEVVYCKRCVLSNQGLRLMFNEDLVCAACLFAEYK